MSIPTTTCDRETRPMNPRPHAHVRWLEGIFGPIELPWSGALGWGSGSLPLTIASYVFGVLLLRFLTDSLALSAAVAGAMVAASKLVDAVIDPLVGSFSDRTRGPMGRRRPWMLAGAMLLAAGIALLFTISPHLEYSSRLILVGLGLLVYSLGYAAFAVPWLAMPAEMTDGYHTRTVLLSLRIGFNAVGQTIATVAGPFLLAAVGEAQGGYARVGWLMAALVIVTGLLSVRLTRHARATVREPSPRAQFWRQARSVFANRPFTLMLVMKVLFFLSLTIWGGALPYLTKHVMGLSDAYLGSFFLAGTLGMLIAQPFWVRLSRALGKKRAFDCALWADAAFLLSFYFVGPSWPPALFLLQAFANGVLKGGTFLLTQALLPDTIEYDYLRTGTRREGVLSGVYAFIEKSGSALGVAALGVLLGAFGYEAAQEGVQPSALQGIVLCASLIPALAMIAAGIVMRWYHLSESTLAQARAQREHSRAVSP